MKTLQFNWFILFPFLFLFSTPSLSLASSSQRGILILSNETKGKKIVFEAGMKVIVKRHRGKKVRGIIDKIEDQTIHINGTQVDVSEIKSIRYRDPMTNWLRGVGKACMIIGGLLTIYFLYVGLPGLFGSGLLFPWVLVLLIPGAIFIGIGSIPFFWHNFKMSEYNAQVVPLSGENP